MADGLHEVYFGGGAQDLVHVPPGRVTSATYAIEDFTESDDAAARFIAPAGSVATVDTYNAALSAAAGPGTSDPRLVTIAGGVAPTVGRAYVLELADTSSEPVRCRGASTTTLRASIPISGSYPATTSSLRGVELRASFPADAAADEDRFDNDEPCFITWIYTLRGLTYRVREQIRLERHRSAFRNLGEVELALREGFEELVLQLGPQPLDNVVRYAARRLESRMRGKSIATAEFFAGVQAFDLLLQRSIVHLADLGCYPKGRNADLFRSEQLEEFRKLWDGLTVGSPGHATTDVDRSTDTASSGPSRTLRNPFVSA